MISVGIDVSKEKSMICVIRPYGEVVASPYEITHTETAMGELVKHILSLDGEVRVVMEATGTYHLPVLYHLKQVGIFTSVINPLLMKRYSATAIRKGKTDKMDSVRIANYGIDNWFKLEDYQPRDDTYDELRFLGRQYSHYIALKVKCKLGLINILDQTMPGLKNTLRFSQPYALFKDKLCDFVERYLHYDNIVSMGENDFTLDYCTWAKEKGYHASVAKAKSIYQMAADGIPTLSSNAASTKMLTLEAVRVLREVYKTLHTILSQMNVLATKLPEYDVVCAMPGIGSVLAVRLIAEIGDVRRFHSGRALVAYAGIDAPPFESGKFVGTKRSISKRGSSLLRKTGYEAMKCVVAAKPTEDAAIYDFIVKKQAEGKPKKVAKIAGLNKFLRVYYARVMELY